MLRCIRNVRAISTRHAIFSKTIEEPTAQKLSQQTNTLVRSPLQTLLLNISPPKCHRKALNVCHQTDILLVTLRTCWSNCLSTQKQGQRRRYFSLTLKMSFLNSHINLQLPLTNSVGETELKTTFRKTKPAALNHDMGKETARRDSQNTNKCQERLNSITVKEYSTDDLLLNTKTTPTLKRLSWTTEEKGTLPLVRSRHHRGDRVILLVLRLTCAAALGLSLLMLFGILRPYCPPGTKIGKYESPRSLCNLFPLNYMKTTT